MKFCQGRFLSYRSYDYMCYKEPTAKCEVEDSEAFKDVDLMLFDKVIAFDHLCQKIILIANISLDDPETGYNKAIVELNQLRELLLHGQNFLILIGCCGLLILPLICSIFREPQIVWRLLV